MKRLVRPSPPPFPRSLCRCCAPCPSHINVAAATCGAGCSGQHTSASSNACSSQQRRVETTAVSAHCRSGLQLLRLSMSKHSSGGQHVHAVASLPPSLASLCSHLSWLQVHRCSELARKALQDGHAVVIGLQSTGGVCGWVGMGVAATAYLHSYLATARCQHAAHRTTPPHV
jgi:hypothetical protein